MPPQRSFRRSTWLLALVFLTSFETASVQIPILAPVACSPIAHDGMQHLGGLPRIAIFEESRRRGLGTEKQTCFRRCLLLPTTKDFLQLFGYHGETHQSVPKLNSNIGRVTPLAITMRPTKSIGPSIESNPATIGEHLVPCAEIHGGRIGQDADVAQGSRAVARRNIHAS